MRGVNAVRSASDNEPLRHPDPSTVSTNSLTLSPTIIAATTQDRIVHGRVMAKVPTFLRSDTNSISGIIANGSCIDRTTWLRIRSCPVPCESQSAVITNTGTIAMPRVSSRRAQGGIRIWRKPSITICPASVPVIVELKPAASKATAKSADAKPTPSNGDNSL